MIRYFISDLHLQTERPEITRALLYFLDKIATDADELYLLGDIFEVWIGDDCTDPCVEKVAPALKRLADSGCSIYLTVGNRDFLMGTTGAAMLSAKLLPSISMLDLPQGKALLLHGDELCTADIDYQAFRALVRQPLWQAQFLAKPLSERQAIARSLRQESKAAGAEKSEAIMDVTPAEVDALMYQHHASIMIHGHTHRPKRHSIKLGERIVLGDWGKSGWYLRADPNSVELVCFDPSD